ncbi:phage replisome organizer N-terminal domain-containing protein [Brochothrix thermosphacta]|uniref:Phage replisome organiser N-terminal domain-containing protein n=1 Tax=Brochothrix thermosphacta TaxID=2756 RepID=A0A2X0QIM2_BROTH|nr:phage replisome organizer N-terminal domain-containing protein [Brochothrix thermosphacta]SPP28436.1 hypothetical protein BTBSAS_200023 [Brochothrix thermosphacta]
MSDTKKYYYLKLKESFFDSDEMKVLEAMPDGHKYSNILLKLYLKSLKNEGKLMLNDHIPYNTAMLATITNHSVGDVERALNILESLSLIEVLDNGSIYMLDIQTLIGKSSSEGDRKKAYRMRIEAEKTDTKALGQLSGQMSDIRTPELELEKELEIDIEIKKEKEKKPSQANKFADDSPSFKLSDFLFICIKKHDPKAKQPNMQTWAAHIDKLIRLDGREPKEIQDVIIWCQTDGFWYKNILSTKKLRDKFSQLVIAMKDKPKNSQSNKPDIIPDWLEKQIAEEQEQTAGVVKPVIVKEKTEIKTDPAMLERIAQFRKELKGSAQ